MAFVAEELKQVFDPRGGRWTNGRYVGSLVAAIGDIIERHIIDTASWRRSNDSPKALPDAVQVADRWHLMENASRAFHEAVRKSMRQVRAAIGAATINPSLLTAAERIQYEGYLRREEDNATILGLAEDGITIKEIVRRTGRSRGLVRRILRGQRSDVFRARESSLELYLP